MNIITPPRFSRQPSLEALLTLLCLLSFSGADGPLAPRVFGDSPLPPTKPIMVLPKGVVANQTVILSSSKPTGITGGGGWIPFELLDGTPWRTSVHDAAFFFVTPEGSAQSGHTGERVSELGIYHIPQYGGWTFTKKDCGTHKYTATASNTAGVATMKFSVTVKWLDDVPPPSTGTTPITGTTPVPPVPISATPSRTNGIRRINLRAGTPAVRIASTTTTNRVRIVTVLQRVNLRRPTAR